MKKDSVTDAMKAFLKHLPNPGICANSTIITERTVGSERLRFIAQKTKAASGYCSNVHVKLLGYVPMLEVNE
ncbi:hypothetical protein [Desertivirga arenae]|uniref:hypothetical protein n=1 Tax=Desertivirga arenae TaxID=2810309 RepID=UPI001A965686|nr:hypothetical protein [Pedobacter sp. SYSU D00823]